jgi:uracil phosphoribosyltransferase
MTDPHYAALPRPRGGIEHHYGAHVHLLSEPYPMSLLARLCAPETTQPLVGRLVGRLYDWMLGAVSSTLLDVRTQRSATRMVTDHPLAGHYDGERIADDQRVVVVDIARAGMLPAHHIYQGLHDLIGAAHLRQDHIVASRETDDDGVVIGVRLEGVKIGGAVSGATVLIPDPMAATGTSVAAVLDRYLNDDGGPPRVVAVMHLIVTPEYLARITRDFPDVHIFAVRLDRGLSPPDVLAAVPGARWSEERGLNDIQYIVPGAGGVGELLNNSWV